MCDDVRFGCCLLRNFSNRKTNTECERHERQKKETQIHQTKFRFAIIFIFVFRVRAHISFTTFFCSALFSTKSRSSLHFLFSLVNIFAMEILKLTEPRILSDNKWHERQCFARLKEIGCRKIENRTQTDIRVVETLNELFALLWSFYCIFVYSRDDRRTKFIYIIFFVLCSISNSFPNVKSQWTRLNDINFNSNTQKNSTMCGVCIANKAKAIKTKNHNKSTWHTDELNALNCVDEKSCTHTTRRAFKTCKIHNQICFTCKKEEKNRIFDFICRLRCQTTISERTFWMVEDKKPIFNLLAFFFCRLSTAKIDKNAEIHLVFAIQSDHILFFCLYLGRSIQLYRRCLTRNELRASE